MNPDEIEFLAERQLVSIIPTFTANVINLVSGDIGPFRASLPVNVPLWLALNLKRQRKCKIQPPDWMDVVQLEALKQAEKVNPTFTKMPSEHYMVEAKLLLDCAADDIPRADEIRTIIKDIWDIRMSKVRWSMHTLVSTGGSYGTANHLTLMEINSMRPLLPDALNQINRMKKRCYRFGSQTQGTVSTLLNSSNSASTSK